MNLVLVTVFVGTMAVTSYRSVPEATDSSPFITSIGERTNPSGVAVSQDLLKSGKVKYGDYLYIDGLGIRRVNDTMHHRHQNHLDFWVKTLKDEQEFHRKYKGRKFKVYVIRETVKEKHK